MDVGGRRAGGPEGRTHAAFLRRSLRPGVSSFLLGCRSKFSKVKGTIRTNVGWMISYREP